MINKMDPKIIWPIVSILFAASVSFFVLKEKARVVQELTETIEIKTQIEKELQRAIETKEEAFAAIRDQQESKDRQMALISEKLEDEIDINERLKARLETLFDKMIISQRREDEGVRATPQAEPLVNIDTEERPLLYGNILDVDGEYPLIVINLGDVDNVKRGDILSVYRNKEFIGSVRIAKSDSKCSIGYILDAWQHLEFKVGDEVRKSRRRR